MEIKEAWKNHPLYKEGVVQSVPMEWLWNYWGRDVSPRTILSSGREVSMEELWEDIEEKGLEDPLILRVGIQNKKFRLEAGNHRIQVLHEHGVQCVPMVVQLRDECGPHVKDVMNDATHNFDIEEELLVSEITQEYMKPTDVLSGLNVESCL